MSVRAVLRPAAAETTALLRLLGGGSEEELHAHPFVMCSVALSDAEHGLAAISAAAAAAPLVLATSLDDRLRCVAGLRRGILAHREEILGILREEGCPRILAEAQLNGVLDVFERHSLDHVRAVLRQEITAERHTVVLQRQPDGVVCVDPPANAPLTALSACLVVVAGNAVVLRVPRSCPTSLSYVLHNVLIPAFEEAGMPVGAFNVLCGDYEVHMPQWLDSPQVDSIFYFGSSDNGLALEQRCTAKGKKAILELSGNDGVLVWHDADLDHAAAALTECFHASGQLCFAPKYAVVHPAVADAVLDRLRDHASRLRPGDPDDPDTVLSPVLRTAAFTRHVAGATAAGATTVCGGHRIDVDGRPDPDGLFVEPTVLRVDGLALADTLSAVREETFYPLLCVVVPETRPDPELLDAAIAFLNANEYGLRNSLWADDPAVIERFTRGTTNGGVLKVNDSHLAHVPYLPALGGTGRSSGVNGEAGYPFVRASRLQGVAIATTPTHPRDALLGRPPTP